MTEPFREAPVLVAPPDDCPHCRCERIQPYNTSWPAGVPFTRGGDSIVGYYRCGDCSHTWNTTWRIDTLSEADDTLST